MTDINRACPCIIIDCSLQDEKIKDEDRQSLGARQSNSCGRGLLALYCNARKVKYEKI